MYISSGDVSKSSPVTSTKKPSVITTAGTTYLITGDVNFRQAGEGTKVLAVIPKGTTVVSKGKQNDDWYQVTYQGKTGYVIVFGADLFIKSAFSKDVCLFDGILLEIIQFLFEF